MQTDSTHRAAEITFLAVLVAVGAALRFYRLGTGLWYDEVVTLLDSVRHPLADIVTHFPGNNDHPLYSVLGHLSVAALGEDPWTLRLPSVLFGLAAIPMVYFTGTAVTNRHEAGAAALILTTSYHHIWFSQNARGYTALLVFALLSTLALCRWLDTGRRSCLLLFAVATAAGSYAHLTMVLVCLSQAVVCGLEAVWIGGASRVRVQWRDVTAAFAGASVLTLLLYAPMVLAVRLFFTTDTASATEVATPAWALLAALRGVEAGFGLRWGLALAGFVFLAGAWSYLRQRPTIALLFLLPVPVTLGLALALNRPIFPRFLFFAIGFVLLITVRGASSVGTALAALTTTRPAGPQIGAAMMVTLIALGAVVLSARSLPYGYRHPKQDYAGAVAFVERTRNDGDLVAVIGETGARPVLDYLDKPWHRVNAGSDLRLLRQHGAPVWLVYTFPAYIQSRRPDLWRTLLDECAEIGEFEGTVAGGTISVRRCP